MSKDAAEASLWMTGWMTGECFRQLTLSYEAHIQEENIRRHSQFWIGCIWHGVGA